jgi:hypothetical protein
MTDLSHSTYFDPSESCKINFVQEKKKLNAGFNLSNIIPTARAVNANGYIYILTCPHKGRGMRIRTYNLCFIRRGSQPIELPLKDKCKWILSVCICYLQNHNYLIFTICIYR